MSLPSRLERLMLDAAGLGIGVGNDQLFFRNELVSEFWPGATGAAKQTMDERLL